MLVIFTRVYARVRPMLDAQEESFGMGIEFMVSLVICFRCDGLFVLCRLQNGLSCATHVLTRSARPSWYTTALT
eukprot:COSAG02_NODE_1427_length_12664_cov_3.151850_12_plen_74_part_00